MSCFVTGNFWLFELEQFCKKQSCRELNSQKDCGISKIICKTINWWKNPFKVKFFQIHLWLKLFMVIRFCCFFLPPFLKKNNAVSVQRCTALRHRLQFLSLPPVVCVLPLPVYSSVKVMFTMKVTITGYFVIFMRHYIKNS